MRTIDRLKKEAIESCEFRGHIMGRFAHVAPDSAYSICRRCGAEVSVDSRPMPNEIDIGGEAVGLSCIDGLAGRVVNGRLTR